ncbi:MAG: amidase [Gammaproteobacteria bacterium]|nr:amidase [Gammaproteobacteria bacterium]
MKPEEYLEQDGLGLAALIRDGEVSVAEVLDCGRRVLDALNPRINAVIEAYPEALAGSDDAGAPFHGVPFLIKDLVLHAAGQLVEMGSRLARGVRFNHDTDLMARFRGAGLRTLGRSASPEFGYCPTTETVVNGPTRNPWDAMRMAGGSSGGSAAAVAAGIVPVAHANDGGGSIRIPASCCGLVGLKPTRGRTPIGPDFGEGLNGLGVEFAVTRTVRDAAALLDAVQGAGLGDPYVIAPPRRSYNIEINKKPKRLRIALMTASWGGQKIDPAVVAGVKHTARQCEALGHRVTEAAPPLDWEQFVQATLVYWTANLPVWIDHVASATGRPVNESTLEATTLACYRHGKTLKATDLLHAMDTANVISRSTAAFFQKHDVLLTPTLPVPPLPLGSLNANDPSLDAEGWTRKAFDFTPFTPLFNMTGQPAISLPLARMEAGLPLGMQFVARYGEEAVLLRLAAQLEEAQPWPRIAPLARQALSV